MLFPTSYNLDPGLWRWLPTEILILIIENTVHDEDANLWIKATKGSRLLRNAALCRKWATLTIDEEDVYLVPGRQSARTLTDILKDVPDRRYVKYQPHQSVVKVGLKADDTGLMPVQKVQRLVVKTIYNFMDHEPYKWSHDDYPPRQHFYQIDTLGAAVRQTIKDVSKYAHGLRSLVLYGLCPPVLLNAVSLLNLTSLSLRCGDRRYEQHAFENNKAFMLDFTVLHNLKTLKKLNIANIHRPEITSLTCVLVRLVRLESLSLATEELEGDHDDMYKRQTMPDLLTKLFTYSKPNNEKWSTEQDRSSLPPCLKHLWLKDGYNAHIGYTETCRLMPLDFVLPVHVNIDLDSLELYMWDARTVAKIINLFPQRHDRRINISYRWQRSLTLNPPTKDLYDAPQKLFKSLTCGVNEIKLFGFEARCDWLASPVQKSRGRNYQAKELILDSYNLGSWSRCKASDHQEGKCDCSLQKLLDINFLYNRCHHGLCLERVRFNDGCRSPPVLSGLRSKVFEKLKVLLLKPRWPRKDHLNTENAADSGELPFPDLCAKAFPELRVLVFGQFWYWIERIENNGPGSSFKVWPWHLARRDPHQDSMIDETLGVRDWSFLRANDIPRQEEAQLNSKKSYYFSVSFATAEAKSCTVLLPVEEVPSLNKVNELSPVKLDEVFSFADPTTGPLFLASVERSSPLMLEEGSCSARPNAFCICPLILIPLIIPAVILASELLFIILRGLDP